MMAFISAFACSGVTPDFSQSDSLDEVVAAAVRRLPSNCERRPTHRRCCQRAKHDSRCRGAPVPDGMTPITVNGCRSSVILRPTIFGSEVKLCAPHAIAENHLRSIPMNFCLVVELASQPRLQPKHMKVSRRDCKPVEPPPAHPNRKAGMLLRVYAAIDSKDLLRERNPENRKDSRGIEDSWNWKEKAATSRSGSG